MPHRHQMPQLESEQERESRGAWEGRSGPRADAGGTAAARPALRRVSTTGEGARHRAQLSVLLAVMLISFDNDTTTTNVKHAPHLAERVKDSRGIGMSAIQMRVSSQYGGSESAGAYFVPERRVEAETRQSTRPRTNGAPVCLLYRRISEYSCGIFLQFLTLMPWFRSGLQMLFFGRCL